MSKVNIMEMATKTVDKWNTVYRIDRTSSHGRSHGLDRDEDWSVELDSTFSIESDARDYVIEMNRRHCGYELGVLYSNNMEFIADRCTDPEWCHRQRYFLGHPNIDLITVNLRKEGVNVLRHSKL